MVTEPMLIREELQLSIDRIAHLVAELQARQLSEEQRSDVQGVIAGVDQFQQVMQNFPNLTTQTDEQLSKLRHDLLNGLNLVGGFAFVFIQGFDEGVSADELDIAHQIHRLTKELVIIVRKII
jgi:hypothetical protein